MPDLKELAREMRYDRASNEWLLWRSKGNRWEYRQLFPSLEPSPTHEDFIDMLVYAYKQDPNAIVFSRDDLRDGHGDMPSQTGGKAKLIWMYMNGQMRVKDVLEEWIYLYDNSCL